MCKAALWAGFKLWIKSKSTLGRSRKGLKGVTLKRTFCHKSREILKCILGRDDGNAFEVENDTHWIWGSALPPTG